jgi:DNA-binding CsgD family transcriptional regulator/sugar-specific transcriptional regulator TrmB
MMLTMFGVGAIADAVYQAMLNDPKAGVAQLAVQLDWTDERVREGLDELARLSLVRPSSEAPGEFRPVPPQVGLSALLLHQEAELRQRQDRLAAGKVALERLIEEYAALTRQRYTDVEQLVGLDSIRGRIESLACECESEIMVFAPDGPQTEENLQASRPIDLAVLQRGVRMRTIYQDSVVNDAASASYAGWLVEQGAQVRTTPVLPPRMIIYDRTIAIMPMDPNDSSVGAVLLRGTGMVTALCSLFSWVWESAQPLSRDRSCDDQGLTGQERAVLQLLAEGHTDEAVARKLAVSVRTGRRITANLTSRLGARSRFQAGVYALLKGWLDPANLDGGAR